MKKTIDLGGQMIEYMVRESRRASNLRMTIGYDEGLVVSVPQLMPWFMVERFLQSKSRWILKHLDRMKQMEGKTVLRGGKRDYLKNKDAAFAFIKEGVEFFNRLYKFPYRRISIRNQKTLWGSCTRSGNLQFNYQLLYLPASLAQYIIVHELCHLKEHNHSKHFWDLVAQTIPDHKAIRKKLHKYIIAVA